MSKAVCIHLFIYVTILTCVASDSNLDLRAGLGKKISAIASIPTSWHWTYTSASSGLVADVSYDLWLSNTAGTSGASSSSTYEMSVNYLFPNHIGY